MARSGYRTALNQNKHRHDLNILFCIFPSLSAIVSMKTYNFRTYNHVSHYHVYSEQEHAALSSDWSIFPLCTSLARFQASFEFESIKKASTTTTELNGKYLVLRSSVYRNVVEPKMKKKRAKFAKILIFLLFSRLSSYIHLLASNGPTLDLTL